MPSRDPCQLDLERTAHVTSAAGWLWSRRNPPASTNDNLPGKWMLFPRCGDAVSAWRIIADAALGGRFWLAKIAPRASSNGHLICVYTPDFTDLGGVEVVAQQLDDLGLVRRRLYYKPDIFTYAGIYRSADRRGTGASIYEYVPQDRRIRSTSALSRAHELLWGV